MLSVVFMTHVIFDQGHCFAGQGPFRRPVSKSARRATYRIPADADTFDLVWAEPRLHKLMAEALAEKHAGAWTKAVKSFRKAIKLARQVLPSDHMDILAMECHLASLFIQLRRFGEAEFWLRAKIMPVQVRLFGPIHPIIGSSLFKLAVAQDGQGLVKEAAQTYSAALQIMTQLLGENHEHCLHIKEKLDATLAAVVATNPAGGHGSD
eukprot:TRINITY_DN66940_c0_g1_i1.p1 TRINITY_DN66940_c0_g1~~TRINITY_DN66940_c0_g1_i1.p1  ORF type:complete len:239 (-),score=35.88 TRINITY_DN66940_c0_g1_i1:197-820(-)